MTPRALSLSAAACLAPLALLAGCDRPLSSPPAPAASPASPASPALPPATPPSASPPALPPPAPTASTGPGAALVGAGAARTSLYEQLEPVVGDWEPVEGTGGARVDGSRWRSGVPSASLADQAKRLYGDRYAEFLDGVKAFAFFPVAVVKAPPPAGPFRAQVRFRPEAGKVDQAAGIAFDLRPDGSYLGVRANALEDNLLYFKVVKGRRTVLETVRGVKTETLAWHTLAIEVRGKKLVAEVDGKRWLERDLDAEPRGRLGLWSKADSKVVFETLEVTALAP